MQTTMVYTHVLNRGGPKGPQPSCLGRITMSLSSFIETNADVREYLRLRFPKPEDARRSPVIAPPLTSHYQTVGTAFDYLLRWWLKSRFASARDSNQWIAELALYYFDPASPQYQAAVLAVKDAKRQLARFLRTGRPTTGLCTAALRVAKLDPIFRAPVAPDSIDFTVSRDDIIDLTQLLSAVPTGTLLPKKTCLLNPTFRMSRLVGGADVDLVIDDLMLDVKTTKDSKCWRAFLNQLVGYYLLYLLGGFAIEGRQPTIRTLGIYFARQGHLQVWHVTDIASESRWRTAAQLVQAPCRPGESRLRP